MDMIMWLIATSYSGCVNITLPQSIKPVTSPPATSMLAGWKSPWQITGSTGWVGQRSVSHWRMAVSSATPVASASFVTIRGSLDRIGLSHLRVLSNFGPRERISPGFLARLKIQLSADRVRASEPSLELNRLAGCNSMNQRFAQNP